MLLLMSLSLTAASYAQTDTTSNTPAATTTEKPKRVVFRATKDQVKEAQTIFKDKNLYTGEVTGKSNADWKAAVKNYQGENGLAKSGSLNRATLEKMGIALTDKQKLPKNRNLKRSKPRLSRRLRPRVPLVTCQKDQHRFVQTRNR